MTLTKRLLATMLALSALTGCWLDDDDSDDARADQLPQGQIQNGTYKSTRCFKNKLESIGADRWSNAQFTFNENGTGSGSYDVFTDSGCTQADKTVSYDFKTVSLVSVDGVMVFKLEQDGSVVDPTWYIPATANGAGYSFDVDATDGESGPYLFEPTPTQLESYRQNPGQGVSFEKQ